MKPISDDAVGKHRHILMYDDETVLNAVIALRDAGGQDWWYLVVDLEGGGYAVGQFSDLTALVDAGGEAALQRALGDLVGDILPPVDVVVEQERDDLDAVRDRAADTESRVAVVERGGEFRGILPVAATRGSGLFDAGLVEMAGKYADIPERGTLSRRRKKAKGAKK
jgi:hypothetical protein